MATELTAGAHEYDEFFKGNVWRDIKGMFEQDLQHLRNDEDDLEGAALYKTIGSIRVVNTVLALESKIKKAFEVQELNRRKAETKPKETSNG